MSSFASSSKVCDKTIRQKYDTSGGRGCEFFGRSDQLGAFGMMWSLAGVQHAQDAQSACE
eukprot:5969949-Amphidinium_carterae.1